MMALEEPSVQDVETYKMHVSTSHLIRTDSMFSLALGIRTILGINEEEARTDPITAGTGASRRQHLVVRNTKEGPRAHC